VPFLDYRFVELCASIPGDLKLKGFTTKALFRSAMAGILPEAIRSRGKQGYSLPIKNWFRYELKEYMLDTLRGSDFIRQYCHPSQINDIISQHLAGTHNRNHELWALLNLAVWHRLFIEDYGK
jgi:asparagine synthase (glutamine-hydrolysing)